VEKRGFRQALGACQLSTPTRVGFADEMRIGLHGMVRRVWGRRGTKVCQRVQIAYRWRYLFLAVDSQRGQLYWCWRDTLTGIAVRQAVRGLGQNTPITAVVWDRAPGHRDEGVQLLGMPLITLPPYSPELNPAERVFEEVRRVVEGTTYASLDDKVAAVTAVLEDLDADPARVRRLTNWAWIAAALQQLPEEIAA
jgi:transposase